MIALDQKIIDYIRATKKANGFAPSPRGIVEKFGVEWSIAEALLIEEMKVEQTAKPTTESKVSAESKSAPVDERLTEQEAIQIVQQWTGEDAEVELSDRRTFEEMLENLREAAEARGSTIPEARFERIVRTHAPNAPRRTESKKSNDSSSGASYPRELAPLVQSGVATYQDGVWLANRCEKCGNFRNACCGRVFPELAVRDDGQTFTGYGRQAVGIDPIKTPKPPKTIEQIQQEKLQNLDETPWWREFRGVDELEGNGSVKMYIENFLPEGVVLICGLPKEGKSFLALSIAKALTSGKPLFGHVKFPVPEIVPVLYLAAEGGDGALKVRCQKMEITNDKTRFISRTLTQGVMLALDDPKIEGLVKDIRPVVILETLIRFNEGKDEDSSTENRKLAEGLFQLIAWGARAVIGIHHSRKDLNKANPTKEAAVRGSGDGLAMVDAVWLVMQDEKLHQGGKGPNEVELVGWGRDFNPLPIRLALTKVAPDPSDAPLFSEGIVSNIDADHDLKVVPKGLVFKPSGDLKQIVEKLVTESPSITLTKLCQAVGEKPWGVRKALKQLGYRRDQGDKASTQWVKTAA